jgi:hypothetical protein
MWNQEMVDKAIENGDVRKFEDVVTIGERPSPTKKEEKASFMNYRALTATGMAALCGGKYEPAKDGPEKGKKDERTDFDKEWGACNYFNYGFDLELRQAARTKLLNDLQGSEKQIVKLATMLLLAENSPEDVKDMIMNSPKWKATENLEAIVDAALRAIQSQPGKGVAKEKEDKVA